MAAGPQPLLPAGGAWGATSGDSGWSVEWVSSWLRLVTTATGTARVRGSVEFSHRPSTYQRPAGSVRHRERSGQPVPWWHDGPAGRPVGVCPELLVARAVAVCPHAPRAGSPPAGHASSRCGLLGAAHVLARIGGEATVVADLELGREHRVEAEALGDRPELPASDAEPITRRGPGCGASRPVRPPRREVAGDHVGGEGRAVARGRRVAAAGSSTSAFMWFRYQCPRPGGAHRASANAGAVAMVPGTAGGTARSCRGRGVPSKSKATTTSARSSLPAHRRASSTHPPGQIGSLRNTGRGTWRSTDIT